jgi:two-component system copper resistance phosphate regulon response regulator CusR
VNNILIAEDEDRISLFIEKGLRAAGYSTTVVADGDGALEMARAGRHDLVLLDVGLRGIDGFEVLRRIRSQNQQLPVIMLTARTSVEDTVAGLEGGANDYMPKPFRFDELLARERVERQVAAA